jgi:uncharacterized OB-fold protein
MRGAAVRTSEQTPVADDLLRVDEDGAAALVGSRCGGCGHHYFPKSLSCRNPRCETKEVHEVLLGRRGHLYSYTVQAYQPPALFRMDPWAPYVIGLVELPEGLRVLGMLTGCEPEGVEIGMPLQVVAEPLHRDPSGRAVITYKFSPVGGGSPA